jgi:hypothetical protein
MATDIVWTATLTPRFPGVTLAIRVGLHALANGLAKQAERVAGKNDRPT